MDSSKVAALNAELEAKQKKFDEAAVESFWSENGELIYVLKEGHDLVEYSNILKYILETNGVFEHSTNVKVTHADQTHFQVFSIGEDSIHLDGELNDEQSDIDSNAISGFEDFLTHPETPSKFSAERNLEYVLPEEVNFEVVASDIDKFITKTIKRNKDFSITLVCGKDKVLLEYPAIL